ncbi:hypothetical protein [Cyclobacterium amurskyense]|uniref:Lipoprotein n=1 Tax=Cyclobacterium amurskyense TaxID=320787 RepID=A0A0H4PZ43_9BACT|nr:hypothetical protein [Cyclobacterium amurskyense]AKP53697.1 hypothetical protein CA2015_4352 [Cyclobacterium amurskyense]|tara:strand:+ start:7045 stop:7548 length:504 start_codon:yes stop_codon:yes gene_type:complete
MKKINNIVIVGILAPFIFFSCLQEDIVPVPTVRDVKMYMTDIEGNDSLISNPTANKSFRFVVDTDADIATVWPGGERRIMKKVNTETDSLDMFGHPVLIVSDYYMDYGLVKARGFKTALGETGWYTSYTYKASGDFDLTIVVTNHGYNSADYKQVVHEAGTITVLEE